MSATLSQPDLCQLEMTEGMRVALRATVADRFASPFVTRSSWRALQTRGLVEGESLWAKSV